MSMPRNLVLGCGHNAGYCDYGLHFSADFYTVDVSSTAKPDKVLDIRDKKAFQETFKDQQFYSIIFEHLPPELKIISEIEYWKQFLKEDGVLVYVQNPHPILNLPEGHPIFTMKTKLLYADHLFIIPKRMSSKELKLTPELQRYVNKEVPAKELKQAISLSYVTPEIKKFLSQVFAMSDLKHPIFITYFIFNIQCGLIEACFQKNVFFPKSTPKIAEIQEIVKEYKPGKYRQFFSNKTRGIKELESYLAVLDQEKKSINTKVLMDLKEIIENRNGRIRYNFLYRNLNPTRSVAGSTQNVFDTLSIFIARHLTVVPIHELEEKRIFKKGTRK